MSLCFGDDARDPVSGLLGVEREVTPRYRGVHVLMDAIKR